MAKKIFIVWFSVVCAGCVINFIYPDFMKAMEANDTKEMATLLALGLVGVLAAEAVGWFLVHRIVKAFTGDGFFEGRSKGHAVPSGHAEPQPKEDAAHENRMIFGTDALGSSNRSARRFFEFYEIMENGDMMLIRDSAIKTKVNLHDFVEFRDISHQREYGTWDMELCAVDQNGQEHVFDCGDSGRFGMGDTREFDRMKKQITKLTGKPVEDAATSSYDPHWDDDEDDDEYEVLTAQQKSKRKDELDWEKTFAMVEASTEIDRLKALNLDEDTTAKLVGMEVGSALGKVRDINRRKKDI